MILTAPSALRWRISYATGASAKGSPIGSELVKAHRDRRPGCGKRILSWPCTASVMKPPLEGSTVPGWLRIRTSLSPRNPRLRTSAGFVSVSSWCLKSGRMSGGEVISSTDMPGSYATGDPEVAGCPSVWLATVIYTTRSRQPRL
jgi:hypothetical protein